MQQLKVTREVDFTGARQLGVGNNKPQLLGGKSYFVHSSYGDDGYEGTNPSYPLATIEAAEAKLTAGKNDYVFCQGSILVTTEVPLLWDKKDTHLIGLGSGGYTQGISCYGDATDATIHVKSYDIEIAGIDFGANSASYNAMESGTTTCYRNHIHNCSFGTNTLALSGINMWEISHTTIEDCFFGDMLASYGITSGSFVDTLIRNCFFYRIEEKCIYPSTGCLQLWIDRCIFYSPYADAEGTGWAIELPSGSTHCMVSNCQAAQTCDTDAEETPWCDNSSNDQLTCNNGWVNNIHGITLINAGDSAD